MTARSEYIAGLRELAAYLEAHPAVLVPRYGLGIDVHTGIDTGTTGDGVGRAIVDQAAATFGVTPATTRGGHYQATRRFAGGLAYTVLCIPGAVMERHQAQQSYVPNIQVPAGAS